MRGAWDIRTPCLEGPTSHIESFSRQTISEHLLCADLLGSWET